MHRARTLALLVGICAATNRVSAQSSQGELRPGAAVRVRTNVPDASRIKGTLVSATRDSLIVAANDRTIAFARGEVRTLDVKRRRTRTAGAMRLAKWVGGISAAVLLPSSLGANESPCGDDECRTEGGDFAQILAIGFLTSIYGQAIGAIWPGREWLPVAPVSSTMGNIPSPSRGARVRITAPGFGAPGLEGTVASAASDTLHLLVHSNVITIPTSAVTRIEYADGSDIGRGVLRGLAHAAPVAGSYLMIAMLENTTTTYRNDIPQSKDELFVNTMVSASIVTAVIGAGLGAAIAPHAWAERGVSTSLLVTPDFQRKGMRVGVAMRF